MDLKPQSPSGCAAAVRVARTYTSQLGVPTRAIFYTRPPPPAYQAMVAVLEMTISSLLSSLDAILDRYQFRRSGRVWRRHYPYCTDVIDLQISNDRACFTMNGGVADAFVARLCWDLDDMREVDEAKCTVRDRLGILMDGRDIWWPLADRVPSEVAEGIEDVLIPFLNMHHAPEQIVATLENNLAFNRYPPGSVYLAILYGRMGDRDRRDRAFEELERKLTGPWHEKVVQIREALQS